LRDLNLHRFDTIQQCDGRTDGRTDGETPRPRLKRAKHSAIARKKFNLTIFQSNFKK